MGKDKNKQLIQLLAFVKELYDHPDNKEFAAGIQSLVLNDLRAGAGRETWTKQINEIYELCLKKNLREQAEDLYKSFPIVDIVDDLANLYVDMEDARRSNDFDSFGFNLYQQIELIVNTVILESDIADLYQLCRLMPPFIKKDSKTGDIVRVSDLKNQYKSIDDFILISAKDEKGNTIVRSAGKALTGISAIEKVRSIIYLINKKATVTTYYYGVTEEFQTISDIYNVRCHDAHSGGNVTERQQKRYVDIIEDKTLSYLRFLAFLHTFIQDFNKEYPSLNSLKEVFNLQ